MNLPRVLLFASISISIAAIGCKKSSTAPSTQAQTTPTATPAAAEPTQTQGKPAPVAVANGKGAPQPPPLADMIPIKTLEVHLPAEFNENTVPLGKAIEFKVAGNAGQFFAIHAFDMYQIEVRSLSGGPALQSGFGTNGNSYYVLPQTGEYRIVYAPIRQSDIQLSFLAADDPITDPGIRPEQFSVDLSPITQERFSVVPYTFDDGEDYLSSWPTHLAVVNESFEFRIMTVAGYKKMFGKYQRIDDLAALLGNGAKLSSRKSRNGTYELPYPSYEYLGLLVTAGQESLSGEGWHGLRWIGGFDQDETCKPELAYMFEGISNDNKYFILVRSKIANPAAEQQFMHDCTAAEYESRSPHLDLIFDRDISAQSGISFQPHLDELDKAIRSLKFN